jgi:L-threonylcarbamoyladenylate synthase
MQFSDRSELPQVDDADIARAAARLRQGGLVAFPTETVYGLGADARNAGAVRAVFEAKGRPADHPVIVHLADAAKLAQWARAVPEWAHAWAAAFWPGPLTLVLPRAPGVPDAVTGGHDTVGLRVPAHPVAQRLLRAFDGGIAAPSANRYGRISPTSAADVHAAFEGMALQVLDGGPCAVGVESTIVDCSGPAPRLLRPGAITRAQLQRVAGVTLREGARATTPAPGRKPSHYAPRARVVLAARHEAVALVREGLARGQRTGLLCARRPAGLPAGAAWLPLPADLDGQARQLYRALHHADALGLDLLVAVPPAPRGVGAAVHDRLRRAAGLGDGLPEA